MRTTYLEELINRFPSDQMQDLPNEDWFENWEENISAAAARAAIVKTTI
jgi:hypothetical protein